MYLCRNVEYAKKWSVVLNHDIPPGPKPLGEEVIVACTCLKTVIKYQDGVGRQGGRVVGCGVPGDGDVQRQCVGKSSVKLPR